MHVIHRLLLMLLFSYTYVYTFIQKTCEKVHHRIIIIDLKLGLITFDCLVIGLEDSTWLIPSLPLDLDRLPFTSCPQPIPIFILSSLEVSILLGYGNHSYPLQKPKNSSSCQFLRLLLSRRFSHKFSNEFIVKLIVAS